MWKNLCPFWFSFEWWFWKYYSSQFPWCADLISGNGNQRRRSSSCCQARGRRRCTRTPTLQRCSLPSSCRYSNVVLNITEVLNQSMIKYLGADDLTHTQLDPQWSHGGAGDGRSWGAGQSCNIHDIKKMVTFLCWSCSVLYLHGHRIEFIHVAGSQVAIWECIRHKSQTVPENSPRVCKMHMISIWHIYNILQNIT